MAARGQRQAVSPIGVPRAGTVMLDVWMHRPPPYASLPR
jgi:hypothetical protein